MPTSINDIILATPGWQVIYRNSHGEQFTRSVVAWRVSRFGLTPLAVLHSCIFNSGSPAYPSAVIAPDGSVESYDHEARWQDKFDYDCAVTRTDRSKRERQQKVA